MSKKKLDEASVTSMVDGFLAGKKKEVRRAKNKATSQKKDAFWKSISESLMLERDDEPDDWRQKTDISSGGRLSNLEKGGFSVVGDKTEKSSSDKTSQKHGKRAVTGEYIQRVIKARLKSIKEQEPLLWSKFQAMGDKEKLDFKKDIWNKHREKENLRKSSEAQSGGGRSNHEKRVEIASNLVSKVAQRLVDITKSGQEIPSSLSSLSRNLLGFDPVNNTGKFLLSKLAKQDGPVSQDVVDAFVKKALENKKEGNVLDFANTKLDMYPGDLQDKVEARANQKNIPGSENRERGIGTGVRTLDVGDDNLKDAVVQRKDVGSTPVYRMFKDFDVDDILKYYDHYRNDPQEIERARKSRQAAPPESLKDLAGSVEDPSRESEIGSKSTSSILSKKEKEEAKSAWDKKGAKGDVDFKPSLKLDPKDVLNRLSDFKDEYPEPESTQGRMASGLANVLSAKDDRLKSMKDEYHRAAEMVRPLLVKRDVNGQELSPDELDKLSQLTKQLKQKREEMDALKSSPRVSSDDVSDIIEKMTVRGPSGKFIKLQEPEGVSWNDEGQKQLAQRIFDRLNPKRLNVKDGDKDTESQYTLKDFIPDFAAAEEEKVAANIPALKGSRDLDKRTKEEILKNRAEKNKTSDDSFSLANVMRDANRTLNADKERAKEVESKDRMTQAMLQRRDDLEKERAEAEHKLGAEEGDSAKLNNIDFAIKSLLQQGQKTGNVETNKLKDLQDMRAQLLKLRNAKNPLAQRSSHIANLPTKKQMYVPGVRRDVSEAKFSLLELLSDIGDDELKHAETQERKDGWDKAKPEKKMDLSIKFKKVKVKS